MPFYTNWTFWVVVSFFLSGVFLFFRIPVLSKRSATSESKALPTITIIIPARNEAQRIGKLLDSIAMQTLTPHEVLVVDDESTDNTAEVVRDKGFKVLSSQPLPERWTGKSWACWQGADGSSSDILIFLDADVWLEPDFLHRLAVEFTHQQGLISIQPFHILHTAYEQLSAFFNVILMAGLGAFTPLGRKIKAGGAFGPCVACTREDYFKAGGHQASQSAVLESFPLAKAFQQQGIPIFLFGGIGSVNFRMYPHGISDLIEGWSKGFGSGAVSLNIPLLLLLVGWVWACFNVFIGVIRSGMGVGFPIAVSLILYMLFVLQIWWMLRRVGNFHPLTAVLFPLPLIFFALIMLRSLFLIFIRQRVTWRGRDIPRGSREK